ncbi:MAG: DJ-1/PfpI family protein [Anaerolineales bacterium]|nr:DJ-1/PfpI family protein [Anaerolineales bacterium]
MAMHVAGMQRAVGRLNRGRAGEVQVLIAAGFDEAAVAGCIDPLVGAGLEVILVSQATRWVVGRHGLKAKATLTIDQARARPLPRALVVPGDAACVSALWADPRVHTLLVEALSAGTVVAALRDSQVPLARMAVVAEGGPPNLLTQDSHSLSDFIQVVVARVSKAQSASIR